MKLEKNNYVRIPRYQQSRNMMRVSYYLTMILIEISLTSKCEGIRGFFNNIQTSEGSSIKFPEYSSPKEIPLDMLARMTQVTDTMEFIENFITFETDNRTLSNFSAPMNFEGVERSSNILRAKMAICAPELKAVPLQRERDLGLFYYPSCIRIERCGGCCAHKLLTCTAVDSEIVNVEVLIAQYKGGPRLVHKEKALIPVERHTKCKCDCKIQPEVCTKIQKFNKEHCRCECTNTDAEQKCLAERSKIWSKEHCACLCRDELVCTTGYYFDSISCRCEVEEGRRKFNEGSWTA